METFTCGLYTNTLGEFNLNEGGPYADAFLRKYRNDGSVAWMTSLGLAETMKSEEWQ